MKFEEKPVLVVGATGTIGREAARAAAAGGGHVRALVRSRASAAQLDRNLEPVHGDLRDAQSLARALSGVRAALYVSPHEPDEVELAERMIRECEHARVRLVFVGVHVDGATRIGRALRRFLFGRVLPHYRPKAQIAERARVSSADPCVVVATNLFQNDELFRPELLRGSFPQTFQQPFNRVDARDVGLACARALLDPERRTGALTVCGPRSLTGEECAAVWAGALGREVRAEHDNARFEAAVARELSGKKLEDFLATYAVLGRIMMATPAALVDKAKAALGRPPREYESYVRETVARWQSENTPRSSVSA